MSEPAVFLVAESDEPIIETGTVQRGSVDPTNGAFFARVQGHSVLAYWDGFTKDIRCAGFTDRLKADAFCRKIKANTTATTEKK